MQDVADFVVKRPIIAELNSLTEGIEMIKPFKIESESEADAYLKDLLSKHEYRSMREVEEHATQLISDAALRLYFISKAKELLN